MSGATIAKLFLALIFLVPWAILVTQVADKQAVEGINYLGIAALVGAIGAFITILGSFVMQLLTFFQNQQLLHDAREKAKTLEHIVTLTNGASHALNELTADKARLEGEKDGILSEQARVRDLQPTPD